MDAPGRSGGGVGEDGANGVGRGPVVLRVEDELNLRGIFFKGDEDAEAVFLGVRGCSRA